MSITHSVYVLSSKCINFLLLLNWLFARMLHIVLIVIWVSSVYVYMCRVMFTLRTRDGWAKERRKRKNSKWEIYVRVGPVRMWYDTKYLVIFLRSPCVCLNWFNRVLAIRTLQHSCVVRIYSALSKCEAFECWYSYVIRILRYPKYVFEFDFVRLHLISYSIRKWSSVCVCVFTRFH